VFLTGNSLEAWLQPLRVWRMDGAGLGLLPGQGLGWWSALWGQPRWLRRLSPVCTSGDNLDACNRHRNL